MRLPRVIGDISSCSSGSSAGATSSSRSQKKANGNLADVLLFGAFLAWAVACFIAARKRDRAAGTVYQAGKAVPTVITVVIGLLAYGGFVIYLHKWLIGVPVFG